MHGLCCLECKEYVDKWRICRTVFVKAVKTREEEEVEVQERRKRENVKCNHVSLSDACDYICCVSMARVYSYYNTKNASDK